MEEDGTQKMSRWDEGWQQWQPSWSWSSWNWSGAPSCLGNPGEMEKDDMLMSTKSLLFIVFTIHTGNDEIVF